MCAVFISFPLLLPNSNPSMPTIILFMSKFMTF